MAPISKEDREFLTLQYEKAAERYNNIYQSAWTIFSYMSAVSAGLIAFGAERLTDPGLGFLACLPLVFWFWSTYLPLDRYGNQTLSALAKLEEATALEKGLRYFSGFVNPDHRIWAGCLAELKGKPRWQDRGNVIWKRVRRARFSIWVFSFFLHLFWAWAFFGVWDTGFIRSSKNPSYRVEIALDETGQTDEDLGTRQTIPIGR